MRMQARFAQRLRTRVECWLISQSKPLSTLSGLAESRRLLNIASRDFATMDDRIAFDELPSIGFGTYDFRGSAGDLREAIAPRARLVDTSPLYGTEPLVGEAAKGMRDRFFIATKVFPDSYTRTSMRTSVISSLERLEVECIDLLQLHWPTHQVPIEETLGAMDDLIGEGLIRFKGLCNFRSQEFRSAVAVRTRYPIVSNQVAYSLYDRRFANDSVSLCAELGVRLMAYSPLGGLGPDLLVKRDKGGALRRIAHRQGVPVSRVALAWAIRSPGSMAIPKSSHLERMRENALAEQLTLSSDEIRNLEASVRPRRQRTEVEERVRRIARSRLYSSSGQLTVAGRAVHTAREQTRDVLRRAAALRAHVR